MHSIDPDEVIKAGLLLDPAPIASLRETAHEWILGAIMISKHAATYRPVAGFTGPLAEDSRFRVRWFDDLEKGLHGWALIFRAFDHARTTGDPEEFFCGWVPDDRRTDLDQWVRFLTAEIQARLAGQKASGSLKEQPNIESAIGRVSSPDPRVRREACWELGRYGAGSSAARAAIIRALDDEGEVYDRARHGLDDDDPDQGWYEQWTYPARLAVHAIARIAPDADPERVASALLRLESRLIRRDHPMGRDPVERRLHWRHEDLAPFGARLRDALRALAERSAGDERAKADRVLQAATPPLARVGCFRELGYGGGAPSIEAAMRHPLPSGKERVVAYLRAGKTFVMSPGFARDIFDGKTLAGTRSMLTDGSFAWPDVLAYYVERYDVEVPAPFLEHMARGDYAMPSTIDLSALRLDLES